jgi:selenocysteine-specific elongation factor
LVGPDISRIDHRPVLDARSSEIWAVAREKLDEGGLAVPTTSELGLSDEAVHLLIRSGDLVRIADNLVYLPAQAVEIERLIRTIDQPFGVGEAKDALGLSRKYVVPILEWLDSNHVTVRRGETRNVRS